MSSRELGAPIGSKGGHLLCHLNVPTGAGIGVKNESGNRDCMTDHGFGMMDLVKKKISVEMKKAE
jgi:hypothetical protein